ncbi:HipA N-terminal domain-containing protein [Marinobacterium mangrovicola]|uniref:HipA-like protein n=1 Tax=Marinobacterium mangrovicola TaxID=1476959 RepID=A0A4R1G664_9GAMM|nr:HipA N-terminal domain-containing protein [Marinobacterium mangrovicola]TCK02978.1 HipA-like protein [Marinobacterium mangrovicola]
MRVAEVYYNGKVAGKLVEYNRCCYEFTYDKEFIKDGVSIAYRLPLSEKTYTSDKLFPFFENMLIEGFPIPEGIDKDDIFGLITSDYDNTVGAITFKRVM